MRIAKLIEEYIADQKWNNDTVHRNEEDGTCQLKTSMSISNQDFRLYIEGDEKRELLYLYLYAPFCVIEGKSVDTALFFNFLNDQFTYRGRLTVQDDGSIRYVEIIDIENIEPPIAMIENMLSSGVGIFRSNIEGIAAVALTQKTYEAIRADYDKKDAARELQKERENEASKEEEEATTENEE